MTEETGRSLFPERSIYEHQLERPQFSGLRRQAESLWEAASTAQKGAQGHRHAPEPHPHQSGGDADLCGGVLLCVLPPINLQAEEFYFFMLLCCAVYCGCAVLTSGFQGSGAKGYFGFVKKQCRIPMIIAVALVAVAIVGGIVGWQVIRAGAYRDLLTVETGDFATEVEEISYDQIPMLDKGLRREAGQPQAG